MKEVTSRLCKTSLEPMVVLPPKIQIELLVFIALSKMTESELKPQKKKSSGFRIEEILDKDPKIYAEHLFENYSQEQINTIMKGLQ